MGVAFHGVRTEILQGVTAEAPGGAIIGLIGEDTSGVTDLVRLAGGALTPSAGEVIATEPRRLIQATDALNLSPVATLALEHAFARRDALIRTRALLGLDRLRRSGATILLLSHEQEMLRSLSDELWWIANGRIAARGDAREVLASYQRYIRDRLVEWGATVSAPPDPSMRRGDGRAQILAIETLDSELRPAMVWRSGDAVAVRVTVRFERSVDDPVVGIMIRTRIGFEVFGTNTELENVKLGPCAGGETLRVTFRLHCHLCPQEYTLTAASHDPNGVWHDWMEDAVAFTVTDARYTAGVANLKAAVTVEKMAGSV